MHIRVILPDIGDALIDHIRDEIQTWAAPEKKTDAVSLHQGAASIESEYDEALAAPGIRKRIEEAAGDGVDAELQELLVAQGLVVPVVDLTGAAITWLESSVRLGVTPSRTTYMTPPVWLDAAAC